MATRSLDGCRVIKAAERHLAYAVMSETALRSQAGDIKTQQTALQGQLDAIRAQLNATKSQLSATKTQIAAAQGEVKEATAFLKETREKLQVIDVDEDDGVDSGSRKRKTTASLPPDETETGDGKKTRVDMSTAENGVVAKTIVVGEAGTTEANGTYRLCRSEDSFPKWADRKFLCGPKVVSRRARL